MKLRVAVLDMEESLRRLISLIIRQKGHEALTLSEPCCPLYAGAQKSCSKESSCIDLMIIDSRMPRLDAFKMLRSQASGDCKVKMSNKLVLSTSMTKTELHLAEELGCRISKKPFKIEEVLLWLDECAAKINSVEELKVVNLNS